MNKMHKLAFSIILIAVMLLAGCGNKETISTSDNETIEMSDEQITALAETKYYGTYKQFTLWNIETNEEVFNIIGRLCVSHDIINDELIITTKIGNNEYTERLSSTCSCVAAVRFASCRAVIAGSNDFVIFYNNDAIIAAQTRAAFEHIICYAQIVFVFGYSVHSLSFRVLYS